jgi:hypothetical protein
VTEHCVFCGRSIPESDLPHPPFVRHLYCSTSCAQREQNAIRRLGTTSPFDWHCNQRGCQHPAETWCPLCERMLCFSHDPLTPARHHDCVAGPADAA